MSNSFREKRQTENGPPPSPEGLVAIIGRANVGKSTLFNRLTRSSKALVADIPGVTRDRHYGKLTFDDRTFLLVDTGGLVGGEDEMSSLVRGQAEEAVAEADVILLVVDGREGPQTGDAQVVDFLRRTGKTVLLVVNKIDHPALEANLADFYRFGLEHMYPVSATQGLGQGSLLEAIVAQLPPVQELSSLPPGIRVAVLGRPNVGKSSFINHFLGEERLMVSDIPGTTRDAIDTPLNLEGVDYVLVDTAGLRRPSHVIREGLERQMVLKTIKALSRAEVAVLLLDAQEGLTGQDLRIAGLILDQAKVCLVLLNKWDLVSKEKQKKTLVRVRDSLEFMAYVPLLPVSVLNGFNLRKVFPLINDLYDQSGRRATTHSLNEFIRELTAKTPPPMHHHRPVKFLYLTQAEVHPPTFVAFVNQPQAVRDSYRRFLVKQLREHLGIPHAPVRLFL
ncbi:MAG: ribosome biogenesis GTPase Der, partial [Deltaproteobacteria bacterium]|nr:ribosome biogenesis GTPase Der [Deltaproteobacteria bacterium]